MIRQMIELIMAVVPIMSFCRWRGRQRNDPLAVDMNLLTAEMELLAAVGISF